jgi:alpha-tubulin suppressor-like RCC1 family protein
VVIYEIDCGLLYSAALSEKGWLYTWLNNEDGQLGHNNTDFYPEPTLVGALKERTITYISCGFNHMMAAV